MEQRTFTSVLFVSLCLLTTSLFGQTRLGVFGGLHSYSVSVKTVDDFRAGIDEASYGIHAGAKFKIDMGSLYLEPAIVFNSISSKYTVDNEDTPEIESNSLNFDVPLVLGFDVTPLQIFIGPVAHIRFSNFDDLRGAGGYDDNISSLIFGAQVGVGLMIGKVGLDVRYESNFAGDDFGTESLQNQIKLVDTNSRIMGSVVYMFGGGDDNDE